MFKTFKYCQKVGENIFKTNNFQMNFLLGILESFFFLFFFDIFIIFLFLLVFCYWNLPF